MSKGGFGRRETHNVVAVRRLRNQMGNEPGGLVPQHTKTLPKTQFTHDIEGQPTEHLTHVNSLPLLDTSSVNLLREDFDISQDQILHTPQGIFREGGREDPTFPSMVDFIDGIVGVEDALDSGERRVEV